MVTLREEHAQQTRDALIAAGTERFATDGYASTSVARIVEDARVSKGAFYHHFPDKKALLKAVVSAACERSEVMIRQTVESASGSGDLVASALDAAMEAVQNDEDYRKLRQQASGVLSEQERRELDDRHRLPLVSSILDELRRQGELRAELDTQATTALVVALLETTKEEVTANDDPTARYAQFRPVLLRFIRSLAGD